ncbi:MAG: ATP-binding protein [Longimicrobiales bacterium]|nr:ATP-binding protein [Longimicrobiales bacterium]
MTPILTIVGLVSLVALGVVVFQLRGERRTARARNAEIEALERLHDALRRVHQAMAWSASRDELLSRVCDVLVERGGFAATWIGWHDPETRRLVPAATAGEASGMVEKIAVHTDDRPSGQGPSGRAFRSGRFEIVRDLMADDRSSPWLDEIRRWGIVSAAVFPLRLHGEVCGTLNIYAPSPDAFGPREVALLDEVARDLSRAFDAFAEREQRSHSEVIAAREAALVTHLLDSVPGVIYVYDAKGHFLRWNRRFTEVTGYTDAEMRTLHPLDFFRGEDRARLEARIATVFEEGSASVEADFVTKGGETIPYFFTGNRVDFQRTTCLVGMGIDLSERERIEEELREAEASDRMKSVFLATMSHELRTPLNSILGFSGILLQELPGPLTGEQRRQLEMVRASGRHLLAMINDVLDISRIEAGGLEVHDERFDAVEAVRRAAEIVRPLAEAGDLDFEVELPEGPVEIRSDRRRLEQILINLLTNATKFTPEGGVRVVLDVGMEVSPGVPGVRIAVHDTGIGIATEDLPKLFQPFRQLDSTLTRRHEGTGLGLAICNRLAELLGARIEVESEVGEGSTFALRIPTGGDRVGEVAEGEVEA